MTAHRVIDRQRKFRFLAPLVEIVREPAAPDTQRDPMLAEVLGQLVASLPAKQRMVVILRFQEELEVADIARTLDMTERRVRSRPGVGPWHDAQGCRTFWGLWSFSMSMEDQLREALRRRNPSAGFAERVAARAQSGRRAQPVRTFPGLWAASALALAAVVVFTVSSLWQRTQEERAGRRAECWPYRIASEKLGAKKPGAKCCGTRKARMKLQEYSARSAADVHCVGHSVGCANPDRPGRVGLSKARRSRLKSRSIPRCSKWPAISSSLKSPATTAR